MSMDVAIPFYGSSFLHVSDGSLDSELAFATRVMRESRRTGSPLRHCSINTVSFRSENRSTEWCLGVFRMSIVRKIGSMSLFSGSRFWHTDRVILQRSKHHLQGT